MLAQEALEAVSPRQSEGHAPTITVLIGDPPQGPRDALLADMAFLRDRGVSIDQKILSSSPRPRADLIP
jgi:hypothetical protein